MIGRKEGSIFQYSWESGHDIDDDEHKQIRFFSAICLVPSITGFGPGDSTDTLKMGLKSVSPNYFAGKSNMDYSQLQSYRKLLFNQKQR